MTVLPSISLTFDGRCAAAFTFYERCFGGTIALMLTWGDSPLAKDAPPGWDGKILYGRLTLGEAELLGSDVPPGGYESPRGFRVMLSVDDVEGAERVFHALAENGTVVTPLQQTFWTLRYGAVTDQFGIPWEINCEQSQ
jgi:PhnB protein